MGLTGQSKTGETLTGDEAITFISAPVQTLGLSAPTATATGEGETSIDAPVQTYGLDAPSATLAYAILAPVQTFGIDTPTATVSGTGDAPVDAPVQTFGLDSVAGNVGYTDWVIDDQTLTVTGVQLTPTELSLDVRARSSAARSTLDNLDSNAGAFDTRELADGTIQNRDTAAGANTYTVYPPYYMLPPRDIRRWLVDNITRNRTSSDTQAISATITFVAAATRDGVRTYDDASDTSLWQFEFGSNRIVTASVGEIEQGETTTLPLVLTDTQARLVESVAAATAGAYTFGVPDGETFTRDETPTDRQTVSITPPSSASDPAIPADTYVVTGWTSRGSDGSGFRLALEISTRYE